jgi:hypothetical protein
VKNLRFSLAGNKEVSLINFVPIFLVYSIVCRNCMIVVSLRAPMLETART